MINKVIRELEQICGDVENIEYIFKLRISNIIIMQLIGLSTICRIKPCLYHVTI